MNDGLQNCASCAEAARERDEARAERDKENRVRTLAVDHYHLINEAMLQAHERVDRIAEAIGCPVHNQDGDDIDREVIVEAARTLVRERDDARAEVERLREALEETEHEMHLRIRAGYDKTIADSWRAKVAEVERERDAARAEVERLRHHASGMEDELRYGEEVCATIVDERDEVLSQVRTERDDARAEVERLRDALRELDRRAYKLLDPRWREWVAGGAALGDDTHAVLESVAVGLARLRSVHPASLPNSGEARSVVDADWLLENWSTLRDEEELLCTVGGVRQWLGVVLCDALTRPTDGAAAPE